MVVDELGHHCPARAPKRTPRGSRDEVLFADEAEHRVEIRRVEFGIGVDEGVPLPAGAFGALVAGRADARALLIDHDRAVGRREESGVVVAPTVDDDRLVGNLGVEVAEPTEGLGEVCRLVVRGNDEGDQRLGGVR